MDDGELRRAAWHPVAGMSCSRGCPAVGRLLDDACHLDEARVFWRGFGLASLVLNVALLGRFLGYW